MNSIFLEQLRFLFGEDFDSDPVVLEALTQDMELNHPIAVIGDSVLDLVINHLAYRRNKDTEYLTDVRKKYASKKANQKYLNQDKVFTKYLVDNSYTSSPIGGVGLEPADYFYEALIGAIYIQHGFKVAKQYIIDILKNDSEFRKDFSEHLKGVGS